MTQMDLLTAPVVRDLPEARRRRDAGMARSDRDPAFAAAADAAIRRVAAERAAFIVDDVWGYMPEGPRTVDGRAMGAAMQRAARAGVIAPTPEYWPSAQPQCHANPRRVWRSRVLR